LNILHINQWEARGGSARSSLRIHKALLSQGISSRLLVSGFSSNSIEIKENIGLIAEEKLLRIADAIASKAQYLLSMENHFYPSTRLLLLRRQFKECDIVQLYGISGGYFGFRSIPQLSGKKKIIWRLSDMWAFTGHCSYSFECDRWKTGCGECPVYKDPPFGMLRDNTNFHWKSKKRVYESMDLTFVAPSKWIRDLTQESPLIGDHPVEYIPNGVDTSIFHPNNMKAMRDIWKLPDDATVIALSTSTFGDERKGAGVIRKLLLSIKESNPGNDFHVLFYGRRHYPFEKDVSSIMPMTATGYIEDLRLLSTVYNCSDFLLHPATSENLANSTMESLACGTPVFCFDVGGMRDIIIDFQTGYAAPALDLKSMTMAISRYLSDETLQKKMRSASQKMMRERFSSKLEAEAYTALYKRLTEKAPEPDNN